MNLVIRDFTLKNADEWQALLDSGAWEGKDVYFLPAWYRTWEEGGHGEAHCLYYSINNTQFMYPFLYHKIEDYELPGVFYDVETAYSSGGVLIKGLPNVKDTDGFNQAVDEWMREHHVVAEFIRLHPGLNNFKIRKAEYNAVRTDAFLDTSNYTKEKIWRELLSDKTRNMIRKGQKSGLVTIYHKILDNNFNDFIKIYLQSYNRLKMHMFYKFSDDYFTSFKKNMEGIASQVDVLYRDEPAASSIWLNYGNVLHYYLGATADNFTSLPCSDIYFWEMIVHTLKNHVIKTIHWGGGMSLAPDDTLYKYKMKYANRSETIYIGRKVIDSAAYQSLCAQWEKRYPQLIAEHGHKLLRYRERNL